MKRAKQMAYALLVAVLLSGFVIYPMQTEAGVSESVLDSSSLEGSNWSNPEEDVVVSEGTLICPNESTEYTRYISKLSAQIDETFSDLVKMSATVKFNKLPVGKNFILAFGLQGIEALPGEAKNVEVVFENKSGIKVGITAYDEDGNSVTVAQPKACGMSLKKAGTVKIELTTDSQIKVSVNGRTVVSGKLPVSGEGRIGFMQTGECGVEVTNLAITHYVYDRPENVNINEDFEQGAMDVSKLTAKMIDMYAMTPRGQIVEEYNGSQVLRFYNTGVAYVGTLYKYSNFEMSFDVPFIQTEAEYREDGSLKKPGQSSFTVAFGGEQADWSAAGWSSAREAIVFNKESAYSFNNKETLKYDYTEEYFTKQNGGFSVKISVVDCFVNVGMKWIDEADYKTVLSYKLEGGMPNGYVHIWSTSVGQFAVDNLKIENLDDNPNVIETEYKSGKWVTPEDVEYEPMERVYADTTDEDSKKVSWYMLIPVTAGVGVAALAITALIVYSKNKMKKGATEDEK